MKNPELRMRRFHMARLYWKAVCFAFHEKRAPTREEVIEWALDEMIQPPAPPRPPVLVRDLAGVIEAMERAEGAMARHRDAPELGATPASVEALRRQSLQALLVLMTTPVGDGRQLHELGVCGPYLDAVSGIHRGEMDSNIGSYLLSTRVALLKTPVPPKLTKGNK